MKLLDFLTESRSKILGVNQRNQSILRKFNPPKLRKRVDDKLCTKKFLLKEFIRTPETYAVIKNENDLKKLNWDALPKSFVVKPNRGTHGNGILVFYGKNKRKNAWIRTTLELMSSEDISQHIRDILSGRFSMGNGKDVAIIEERIINHKILKPYSYRGIPDIRVIVYKGFPLMAMLRLPTKKSGGTANLHAGGICVGIDIASGITTTAIHMKGFDLIGDRYDLLEETIDEPKLQLRGIRIPYWKNVLELAIKSQMASKLGYVGVDIVIDRDKGPMILELNARPGLGIQMANQEGLLERYNLVKGKRFVSVERAIKLAKTLFGGEIEEEVETITGKEIIGLVETVIISPSEEVIDRLKAQHREKNADKPKKLRKKIKLPESQKIKAKIDTGAFRSSIDYRLAIELGYTELKQVREVFDMKFQTREEGLAKLKEYQQKLPNFEDIKDFMVARSGNGITLRPVIKAEIQIGDVKKLITFTVSDRSELNYSAIIGKMNLKEFLIDPSRTFTA